MYRIHIVRALAGVQKLLTPAVDTNSEADAELQAIRNDLEMALEGEPQSVEPEPKDDDYEPNLEPSLEGEEAEEDEDGETVPEGLHSSYAS